MSLQSFLVSRQRKLWFIARVVLLAATLWFVTELEQNLPIWPAFWYLFVVYLSASVISDVIRFFVITSYRRRHQVSPGNQDNFIMGIDTVSYLVVILVVAGSIFPLFGIPFTNFLTSLSLFSVASAWLFKEYIANFFDSFRLMFSNDFLIGDYIKLNDTTKGVITNISFRATKLKTDDGDVLFVPNSTLMNTEVVNFSKVKFKRITVPFTVQTEQLSDVDEFERAITSAVLEAFPELIRPERTFLRIVGIDNGKTSCVYEVATDQFSFAIEDKLHKTVYRTVLSLQQSNNTV